MTDCRQVYRTGGNLKSRTLRTESVYNWLSLASVIRWGCGNEISILGGNPINVPAGSFTGQRCAHFVTTLDSKVRGRTVSSACFDFLNFEFAPFGLS